MSTTAASTTTASLTATAACVTVTPAKYGHVPPAACNSYYSVNPQFAPAVATATIFGLLAAAHIVLACVYKKPYAAVLVMGALWETAAYVLHALSAHRQQNRGYAGSYPVIVLLAPLWTSAFVDLTLARAVFFVKPDRRVWVVGAVRMSTYAVWASLAALVIQAVGGVVAMPGAGATQIKIGLGICMVGLGLQALCILASAGLLARFHADCRAMETLQKWGGSSDSVEPMEPGRQGWGRVVVPLYAVLALITVRIAYRMAEFGGVVSASSTLLHHEAYSYALDAFPMMLCLVVLAVWHPGRVLCGPDAELPRTTRAERKADRLEKKEKKLEKKQAKAQRKAGTTPAPDGLLVNSQTVGSPTDVQHETIHNVEILPAPQLARPELPAPIAHVPRRTEPQVWGTYTDFEA